MRGEVSTGAWAEVELADSNLGDRRLDRRLRMLLSGFVAKPLATIAEIFRKKYEPKATYRFFENKKVTQKLILESHIGKTAERCNEEKVVLCIQDTTSANYSSHKAAKDLGHIGSSKVRKPAKGIFVHTAFVVNTKGTPLGLLHQQSWCRQEVHQETDNERKVRLRRTELKKKESYRWIETMEICKKRLDPVTKTINVCDRECDIFEFMSESLAIDSSFIIRAKSDRKVTEIEEDEDIFLLSDSFSASSPIATKSISICSNGKRESRNVQISIYAKRICLRAPERVAGEKLKPIEVTVLHAVEETKDATKEDHISWLLLSDIEASDADSALKIVEWYSYRWRIEEFHKTLKSGYKIEESCLSEGNRLIKLISIKSIAAYRICLLTYLARENPDHSAEVALTPMEWKCAFAKMNFDKKKLPKKPPSIKEAIELIARLGGYTGTKKQNPGMVTIWRGWQALNESLDAWKVLQEMGLITYG